jgi:hypothetical protein
MKQFIIRLSLVATIIIAFTACRTMQTNLPLEFISQNDSTEVVLVWSGYGTSYRFDNGSWTRTPSEDYEFSVKQYRMADSWKSVKYMHRLDPEYTGAAGSRDQVHYFEVDYTLENEAVLVDLTSSLGNGTGTTDREFRNTVLNFNATNPNPLYDSYRITQTYQYEEGLLVETVELFKQTDNGEKPFVKIEESASIYIPSILDSSPTSM